MTKFSEKIQKVVVNIGVGKLRNQTHFEDKVLPEIEKEIAAITSQKPSARKAKKSIAGFKVRERDVVGLQVTLRRGRMTDFLERFIMIALPRVKDFRGLDVKNVDGAGNLNVGLKDQHVFPEIDSNVSHLNFGLQITVVGKIRKRDAMIDFYRQIGVPLKK